MGLTLGKRACRTTDFRPSAPIKKSKVCFCPNAVVTVTFFWFSYSILVARELMSRLAPSFEATLTSASWR